MHNMHPWQSTRTPKVLSQSKTRQAGSPKRPEQLLEDLIRASSLKEEPESPKSDKGDTLEILFCGIGDANRHQLHAESLTAACQSKIDNADGRSILAKCEIFTDASALIQGIQEHRPTILHIMCFDQQLSKKLAHDLVIRDSCFLSAVMGRTFAQCTVRLAVLDMHMAEIVAGVLIPQLEFVVVNSLPEENSLRALQELYTTIAGGNSVHQSHRDASSFSSSLRLAGTADPRQVLCPPALIPSQHHRPKPPLSLSRSLGILSRDAADYADHHSVPPHTKSDRDVPAEIISADPPRAQGRNASNLPPTRSVSSRLSRHASSTVAEERRQGQSQPCALPPEQPCHESKSKTDDADNQFSDEDSAVRKAAQMKALEDEVSLLREEGRKEEMVTQLCRLLELQRQELGRTHEATARTLTTVGEVLSELGAQREAEAMLAEALRARRKEEGRESLEVFKSLNNLAVVLERRGKYKEALRRYRESLQICKVCNVQKLTLASLLYNMAALHSSLRMWEEVAAYNRECYLIRREALGERHELAVAARRWWERAVHKMDERKVGRILEEEEEEEEEEGAEAERAEDGAWKIRC